MKINNINLVSELNRGLGLFETAHTEKTTSFQDMLSNAIKNVDSLEKASEDYSVKLASGQLDNIHEAMIAAQKADVSMQYMIQIRNKVLDAYREITRMQI